MHSRNSLQNVKGSSLDIIFDSPISIAGRQLRKVDPLLFTQPIALKSLNTTTNLRLDSFTHDFPMSSVIELNETKLKSWLKAFSLRLNKAGSDITRVIALFRDPELLLYLKKGSYIDDASLIKLCYGLRISHGSSVNETNLPSFLLQVEKLKCLFNELFVS